MSKVTQRILCLLLLVCIHATVAFAQNVPFPYNQGAAVNSNAATPEGKSMSDLNADIKVFYDKWKNGGKTPWGSDAPGYLTEDPDTGFWYLAAPPTHPMKDTPTAWKEMTPALHPVTHSEGHGYAMMIVALMAGHDPEAQTIFNGMVKAYQAYKSTVTEWPEDETQDPIVHQTSGMSWLLPHDLDNPDVKMEGGAADGDMDIAYALLLANAQWGNNGEVKYLDIAKEMLGNDTGLLKFTFSERTNRILSGNWMHFQDKGKWDGELHSNRFNHTQSRPSDWMVDHIRAFDSVLPNSRWQLAIDEIYDILPQVQSDKGLFPDFIEDRPNANGDIKPQPVHIHNVTDAEGNTEKKYIEGEDDDKFFHNACRVPLRLAMDYLIFNSEQSKTALQKFNSFSTSLNSNPDDWMESTWHGYDLNGNKLDANNTGYTIDGAYYGPMIAAMIAGMPEGNTTNIESYLANAWDDMKNRWLGNHTEWVYDADTNTWSFAKDKNWSGYYGDTLSLISMLVVSQNYWNPASVVKPEANVYNVTQGVGYKSLQEAVDASVDGDVLEVTEAYDGMPTGVYVKNKNNLTIKGINTDGERPSLHGSRYGHALGIIDSTNIKVENLLLITGIGRLYVNDGSSDITLDNMYISGGMGEAAIINGKNVTVEDSVLIGSFGWTSANVASYGAENLKLHRNVLYRANGPGVGLKDTKGVEIYNNTFVEVWYGVSVGALGSASTETGVKIKNNIFFNHKDDKYDNNIRGVIVSPNDKTPITDITIDYNLAYDITLDSEYHHYSMGSNYINKDPLLGKGAILQDKSAAINEGTVIPGVTDHVTDGKPDLGAKEAAFAAAPPVAEWSSSEVYVAGDEAAIDGRPYTSKWWNHSSNPEAEAFNEWEADYKEFLPAHYSNTAVYIKGDEVQFDRKFYRAKWWTQGEEPGQEWGAWEEITISPFVHE